MQFTICLFKRIMYCFISFVLRDKKVFVVCGMRRGGNHACINWLLNALDEEATSFQSIYSDRCYRSVSGSTIFFNEASYYGLRYFARFLVKYKSQIRRARNVIISLEDYVPSERFDPYLTRNSTVLIVERGMLNLVASRLQRMLNQAKDGKDRGDMSIDEQFFERAYKLTGIKSLNYKKWSFESWLANVDGYRSGLLHSLGLSVDISPDISSHGGGSSFSGQTALPSHEEIEMRWKKVNWPDRVLLLMDKYKILLSKEELTFIRAEIKNRKLILEGLASGSDDNDVN